MLDSLDELFATFTATRDPETLARVFVLTAPTLLQQAKRVVGSSGAAEDVVQELFLSLLRGRGQYDPSRPCLPFLRGALHRQALRALDAGSRQRRSRSAHTAADDPGAQAERRELRAVIRRAIEQVGPPYADVLHLFLEDGRTPQEIGRMLARPVATVRVQLHRGLARLRSALPPTLSLAALMAIARPAPAAVPLVARSTGLGLGAAALATIVVFGVAHDSQDAAGPAPAPTPALATARADAGSPAAPPGARSLLATLDGVQVQVVDSDGAPLPHVGVRAHAAGSSPDFGAVSAVTGDDGIARLVGLPDGRVRIDLDRGWRRECEVVRGHGPNLRAVIATGRTLRGVVLDPAGRPLAGAAVALSHDPNQPGEVRVVTHSDAAGCFELRCVHALSALSAMFAGLSPAPLVLAGEDGVGEVTLRFEGRSAAIRGVVHGPGGAVADALVLIGRQPRAAHEKAWRGTSRGQALVAVRTAADGSFVAPDVTPGRLELLVVGMDIAPTLAVVETAASATATVRIDAARGRRLDGRVVDTHGAAIAAARVLVHGPNYRKLVATETAADGTFTLAGVDAQAIGIGVAAEGHGMTVLPMTPATGDLLVRLQPESLVTGQLLAPDGQPADARHWQLATDQMALAHDPTPVPLGAAGSFTAVVPEAHRFFARARGSRIWVPCDAGESPAGRIVRVPAVAGCLAPIRLRLHGFTPAQRRDLLAHVGDASGVHIVDVADRDGLVELSPVPIGTWSLHLRGRTGECPPIALGVFDVPAAGLVVDAAMPPHGWLRWQFRREDGERVETAWLSVLAADRTSVDLPATSGRIALAAGDWTFWANSPTTAAVLGRSFRIRAGEETALDVPAAPARARQVCFQIGDDVDLGCCRVEILRDGTYVPEIRSRQREVLLRRERGRCWTVCALQPGRHTLHLRGPGVDLLGDFTVDDGNDVGEPIVVELTAGPAGRSACR